MARQLEPLPTALPTVRNIPQYYQGSSATDPRYSNYVNMSPMSTSSTQLNAYGTPLYRGSVLGSSTTPIVPTDTFTGQFLESDTGGGGGTGDPAPSGDDNQIDMERILAEQRARAQEAYLKQLRLIEDAYGISDRNYNEGIELIGQRKGEFGNLLEQGKQDIVQNYQQRGGEMGTAARGARMRDLASLQSMGLGGSAVERAKGRAQQNEMRSLASLQDVRGQNQRANQGQFDERMTWALGQEGGLRDTRDMARIRADEARNIASRDYADNIGGMEDKMGSYLSQILDYNNQLASNRSAVQGFQANPYNVDMAGAQSYIASQVPTLGNKGNANATNASIDAQKEKNLMAQLSMKQAGGNMYGIA